MRALCSVLTLSVEWALSLCVLWALTLTQVYKKIEDQRVKVNFYLFFEMNILCPHYRLE